MGPSSFDALSRLKGIETRLLPIALRDNRETFDALSRLKGIETRAERDDRQSEFLQTFDALSRLKGIETKVAFPPWHAMLPFDALSRLKGIETRCRRAPGIGYSHFRCTFPFEGN